MTFSYDVTFSPITFTYCLHLLQNLHEWSGYWIHSILYWSCRIKNQIFAWYLYHLTPPIWSDDKYWTTSTSCISAHFFLKLLSFCQTIASSENFHLYSYPIKKWYIVQIFVMSQSFKLLFMFFNDDIGFGWFFLQFHKSIKSTNMSYLWVIQQHSQQLSATVLSQLSFSE